MKKTIFILAGVLVLALGAAVAAPQFIDWDKHKPKIQSAISEFTGYEVRFGGKVDLAVLPFPHVVVEKLSVKVPGAENDVVALNRAEINVALVPLFGGEVSVSSVSLIDPVIYLEIAKDGRKLWMTDKLNAATAAKNAAGSPESAAERSAMGKLALNRVEVKNGTLKYVDGVKGKVTAVEKINTVLSADTLSGPFRGNGDITLNGKLFNFDFQSGRMDTAAKTVALNATIRAAGVSTVYAGLVGTGGGADIQGEIKVEAANISSTLSDLSGKPSTLPPVPANLQGILTAKGEQAEIKSVRLVVGDLQVTGSAGIANLGGKSGTTKLTAMLESKTPFKAEGLIPGKSIKTVKAFGDKDSPKAGAIKTFIPESITLPMAIDVDIQGKLAGLSYKGAEFGDVSFQLQKTGSDITLTEGIGKMPGGGKLISKSTITFASVSQGKDKSGIVYSDPIITFDMNGNANAPGKLLSPFLPEATVKSMQPMFRDPITVAAKGAVYPHRVDIDTGSIGLGKTVVGLGKSVYRLDPDGKNDLSLTVTGQDINVDYFTGNKVAPKPEDKVQETAVTAPAAKKPTAQVMQDAVKKLNLPVDLTLKADIKGVTMQGVTYQGLAFDGSLKGNAVDIKSVTLTDSEGDVMQASGTIKDLKNLAGVDISVGGKTRDANAFLSSLRVDTKKLPKDMGPLDLKVSLVGEKPESLAFTALAKTLDGEGQANGLLLNAMSSKPAVDKLSFRVKHPNFEKLMQKFNPAYKAGVGINKDMEVSANINLEKGVYSLSGLDARLGGMTLTGQVKADTSGTKPDIVAQFNAGTIPLDILSGKDRTGKTSATAPKTGGTTGGDVRWSRNAINTAWMHAFNLDLKVNAKSVEYGNWKLDDTVLAVNLKDGAMTLSQMDAKVYGGTMSLSANVKTSAKDRDPVVFDMKSKFDNVGLEQLASSFSGARVIKARGNVLLDLSAHSTGISPAALIGALAGSGNINGKNIVLEGFDLAAMSRSLVSTTKVFDNVAGLARASTAGGETAFDKIEGPFTISEGIINFDNLLMTGPAATVANKGQVNLPRWVIDMNSTIDLVTPEDAPNLTVRFQGPLDNPGNTFVGSAMESYIQTRMNQKLQKVIDEKLGDKNPELNKLLNNVLGGGSAPAPKQAPVQQAPVEQVPPAQEPAAGEVPQPAPQPAPAKQPSPEEQLINDAIQGLFGQ